MFLRTLSTRIRYIYLTVTSTCDTVNQM